MSSNVGNAQVYENGDQKNVSRAEIEQEKQDKRFHEGKENSHKANDSSEHLRYIFLQNHTESSARGPKIDCKQASSRTEGTNKPLEC